MKPVDITNIYCLFVNMGLLLNLRCCIIVKDFSIEPELYQTGAKSRKIINNNAFMKDYQQNFINIAIESEALCFGEFTLKSGRISPYFFNAGLLYQGKALAMLARCYAQAIIDDGLKFDVIFGPAYKGISLAALTAAALYEFHGLDIAVAYNRKEKKAHGEGGQLVGAALEGKQVLVIDDVITAGTAIREVATLIKNARAQLTAVIIGLNRQERGSSGLSAIQEVEQEFDISVSSIIGLNDIIQYLQQHDGSLVLGQIVKYRSEYGVEC